MHFAVIRARYTLHGFDTNGLLSNNNSTTSQIKNAKYYTCEEHAFNDVIDTVWSDKVDSSRAQSPETGPKDTSVQVTISELQLHHRYR